MEALKQFGYDDVVECPYNKSHQILRSRIQTHLIKCKESFPNAEKMTCPFNTTHHVNRQEYKFHLEFCPDRKSFDLYKYKIQSKPYQQMQGMEQDTNVAPQPSASAEDVEDWSSYDVPTYNPEKYCQTAPVLRMKVGGKPSEKKAFRREERDRLEQFNK